MNRDHPVTTLRLIGPGRAGLSFASALAAAGWSVLPPLGRDDEVGDAASGCDWLLITVPDRAVAEVAAAVRPVPGTVVAHVSGSLGPDALAPHPRRATVHPLVSLPDPTEGAAVLAGGAWFGIGGDPAAAQMVTALGGHAVAVPDAHRAAYHAAACVASNHLVVLLDQAARLAERAGVPLEAYLALVRGTVDNVAARGPRAALTGPVARSDWATVGAHRAVVDGLGPGDLAAYDALATLAARLAGVELPCG